MNMYDGDRNQARLKPCTNTTACWYKFARVQPVEFAYYTQRLVADLSCIFVNSKENDYNITQGLYADTRQKDSTEIPDT